MSAFNRPRQALALPDMLQEAITAALQEYHWDAVTSAALALSTRYRTQYTRGDVFVTGALEASAYAALRMPSTFAQLAGALRQLKELFPAFRPRRVLDIGAGPGTTMWAVREVFAAPESLCAIEASASMHELAATLQSAIEADISYTPILADAVSGMDAESGDYDLVVLSSVLNELDQEKRLRLLAKSWKRTAGIILIVEPGTPAGSQLIEEAAAHLLACGVPVCAPYVGKTLVPNPWLHFSQRITRPEFQRRLRRKQRDSQASPADWEDCAFSYAAFSALPKTESYYARLITPVRINKVGASCTLLKEGMIEEVCVPKRTQYFSELKKKEWGDLISSAPHDDK